MYPVIGYIGKIVPCWRSCTMKNEVLGVRSYNSFPLNAGKRMAQNYHVSNLSCSDNSMNENSWEMGLKFTGLSWAVSRLSLYILCWGSWGSHGHHFIMKKVVPWGYFGHLYNKLHLFFICSGYLDTCWNCAVMPDVCFWETSGWHYPGVLSPASAKGISWL